MTKLVNIYKADLVALQGPFLEANQIEGYKLKLGFDNATANKNGKIWFFWRNNYDCTGISNKNHQITLKCKKAGETIFSG